MSPTILTQQAHTVSISRSERVRIIDVTECIPDITDNYIIESEYSEIPADIFENLVFQALNDLIDDFANNTDKYLKPDHKTEIEQIAHDYLNS